MALRNTFEMPIGHANIKVIIELNDDISGASRANRLLMAQITSSVNNAIAQSGQRDQGVEQRPAEVGAKRDRGEQMPVQAGVKRVKSEVIEIIMVDWTEARRTYRIRPTNPFREVMKCEAHHLGIELSTIRFMFNGRRIGPYDTPERCDFEDGDVVELHTAQAGS